MLPGGSRFATMSDRITQENMPLRAGAEKIDDDGDLYLGFPVSISALVSLSES